MGSYRVFKYGYSILEKLKLYSDIFAFLYRELLSEIKLLKPNEFLWMSIQRLYLSLLGWVTESPLAFLKVFNRESSLDVKFRTWAKAGFSHALQILALNRSNYKLCFIEICLSLSDRALDIFNSAGGVSIPFCKQICILFNLRLLVLRIWLQFKNLLRKNKVVTFKLLICFAYSLQLLIWYIYILFYWGIGSLSWRLARLRPRSLLKDYFLYVCLRYWWTIFIYVQLIYQLCWMVRGIVQESTILKSLKRVCERSCHSGQSIFKRCWILKILIPTIFLFLFLTPYCCKRSWFLTELRLKCVFLFGYLAIVLSKLSFILMIELAILKVVMVEAIPLDRCYSLRFEVLRMPILFIFSLLF